MTKPIRILISVLSGFCIWMLGHFCMSHVFDTETMPFIEVAVLFVAVFVAVGVSETIVSHQEEDE